jgi:hypothetical protein
MQTQTSSKRVSRDWGGSAGPSLQTPTSAGTTTNGNGSPIVYSGLDSTTPVDQSPSRRGSVVGHQPWSPQVQLDQNKTGSSFTSIKSSQFPSRGVTSNQESVGKNDRDSGLRTPITDGKTTPLTPTQVTARPLPYVPTVTSHYHKASLPNMPSSQADQFTSANNHMSNGISSPSRSYQNLFDAKPSSRRNSVAEAEDDMAQFASNFPSLDDFEHKPDFAIPALSITNGTDRPRLPRQKSASGKAIDRPDTIAESTEDDVEGRKLPSLPSPPRGLPGSSESKGLGVPDIPQRPSSLPMPDIESIHIGGTPSAMPAYKPAGGPPPLAPKPQFKPAVPLPKSSPSQPAVTQASKPTLPITNAIMAGTLADYLSNPALRLLLVDIRPSSEHRLGWIGKDTYGDGGAPDCVWVDPTILQRKG